MSINRRLISQNRVSRRLILITKWTLKQHPYVKTYVKKKRKLWEFTISLPTRYKNWPNASMKGIDSMSPASRMPRLLWGENILSPAPECLHLWELLSKIICYFAIGCNDAEWLFTYCATKFYDTDIDLLCHQLDSLRHVQSTLVFHLWCVAQPDKENISIKNGTFPLLRNALNHIFW